MGRCGPCRVRELGADDYDELLRLDEGVASSKAASESQITSLPATVFVAASSAAAPVQCCICLSDIDTGESVKWLPCAHVYHAACIDRWLRTEATCPVDKKSPFE